MGHREDTFSGSGDIQLYYQAWLPEGTLKGILLIVHGFGEYSGRYPAYVEHLPGRGFAVYSFDQRGHGKSPGQRGHINSWAEYRNDVRAIHQMAQASHPDTPIFIFGHSMGSMIVLDYILRDPANLAGAILSGTVIDPVGVGNPLLKIIARVLSALIPTFKLQLGLDPEGISTLPDVVQAYKEDPLVHGDSSARWGAESMKTLAWFLPRANEINLPVLFIHGSDDPFNAVTGTQAYFEQITSEDKAIKIYPGSYHEPHNDKDAAQVAQDVGDWLEAHV
ncbi:MAG: lysophospholipase [Anaerolineales bacterium]|nr:lysophospholipase [Anaerolineales bacterium]